MALRSRIIRPAFSLVESLIVMGIVSGMAVFACVSYPRESNFNDAFWKRYDACYQKLRIEAQNKIERQTIQFDNQQISFGNQTIVLPKNWSVDDAKIVIHENGYVAPQTIRFHSGSKVVKLIYSFGGGQYRVEKEE